MCLRVRRASFTFKSVIVSSLSDRPFVWLPMPINCTELYTTKTHAHKSTLGSGVGGNIIECLVSYLRFRLFLLTKFTWKTTLLLRLLVQFKTNHNTPLLYIFQVFNSVYCNRPTYKYTYPKYYYNIIQNMYKFNLLKQLNNKLKQNKQINTWNIFLINHDSWQDGWVGPFGIWLKTSLHKLDGPNQRSW